MVWPWGSGLFIDLIGGEVGLPLTNGSDRYISEGDFPVIAWCGGRDMLLFMCINMFNVNYGVNI